MDSAYKIRNSISCASQPVHTMPGWPGGNEVIPVPGCLGGFLGDGMDKCPGLCSLSCFTLSRQV